MGTKSDIGNPICLRYHFWFDALLNRAAFGTGLLMGEVIKPASGQEFRD